MKLLNFKVSNFLSYKNLSFIFDDVGLALIHGKTGAGKSTIMDAVSWCLYGESAKNLNVDEIIKWGDDTGTKGEINVETKDGTITIYRNRKPNDLYFTKQGDDSKTRGKDLKETQSLINSSLGVDFDLFCVSSYVHEFSPTTYFFVAKAKERRALLEKLSDTALADNLNAKVTINRKKKKDEYVRQTKEFENISGRVEQLRSDRNRTITSKDNWERDRARSVIATKREAEAYEEGKEKEIARVTDLSQKFRLNKSEEIDVLERVIEKLKNEGGLIKRCPHCQGALSEPGINPDLEHNEVLLKITKTVPNVYEDKLIGLKSQINPHRVKLDLLQDRTNPFINHLDQIDQELEILEKEHSQSKTLLDALNARLSHLNTLYDLTHQLRSELLKSKINEIQEDTNNTLDRFFDSELRVQFSAEEDDLNVQVFKSGYECSYHQLSKGQRGLLKLCFSVSVMKAASSKAGIHFENLFLDEALDGLDVDLKVRAYALFEEMSQNASTVLVIDHSVELQQMFHNKFLVTMDNETSHIEKN